MIVATLFLSGCSLAPSSSTTTAKTYTLSKSIWKSSDSGKTWEAKNKASNKPKITDLNVLTMVINPLNANVIYAGLQSGGMIKTQDGGENWEFTNFVSEKVYGLEIDSVTGKTLYVSGVWQGRGKIFRTDDEGVTWKEIYTAATDGPLVIAMALDEKNSQVVYASTSDGMVIKSSDGGETWKSINKDKSVIIKIAIDPANSSLVYLLSTGGKIFKSEDGGTAFTDISSNVNLKSFSRNNSVILETDPANSGWVYLAGKSGIIRSRDFGKTWEKVVILNDPNSAPVSALAISPVNSNEMVYGAGQAVFRSTDGGITWSTSQIEANKAANILKYNHQNASVLFLGFKK